MKTKKLSYIAFVLLLLLAAGAVAAYRLFVENAADTAAPVITAQQGSYSLTMGTPVDTLLSSVTAFDDEDGDLTDSVFIEYVSGFVAPGKSYVTFAAVDASGNVGKKQCELIWTDYESPRFSLKYPLSFSKSDRIRILDAVVATDCIDGDISDQVKITLLEGSLSQAGNARVELRVTNSMGDTAVLEVTVEIKEPTDVSMIHAPVINLREQIVYLSEDESFDPMHMVENIRIRFVGPQAQALGVSVPDTSLSPQQFGENRIRITAETDLMLPGVHEVRYTTSLDGYGTGTTLYVVRGGEVQS